MKFYALSNAKEVVEGSYVQIQFILDNADGTAFKPPSFKTFQRVQGPSTSTSTSIANGRMTSSKSYTYQVVPNRVGTYTIGPATIKVKGKTMTTKPLKFKVVKSNKKLNATDKDAFLRLEISDSTVYVGQQILLDYRLYTKVDVRNYDISNEPDFDGFFVKQTRSRYNTQKQVINGEEYTTRILKRISIFPQKTGTYSIGPLNYTLGVSTGQQQRGFFMTTKTKPLFGSTDKLDIIVDNVPVNAPVNFSGAIGNYSMSRTSGKRNITTDETMIIKMTIKGNGDDRMVSAPKWDVPDGIVMYDPNVDSEKVFEQQGEFQHTKTFEYLLVAEKPGRYKINPKFSYFDLDSNAYQTITHGDILFTISQGSKTGPIIVDKDTSDVSMNSILPINGFKEKSSSFYGSFGHKGLLGLLILSILGILGYKKKLDKSGSLDPKMIRQQEAAMKAKEKLEAASKFIQANDGKQFYEDATIALKKYFEDRFDIPAIHLKKLEIIEALESKNFNKEEVGDTLKVLEKSEQVLYAPISAIDMEQSKSLIIGIIDRLEEKS